MAWSAKRQVMDEFELIRSYLAPLAGGEGLGLKDDAALFAPEPGYDLIFTKDTLVEGVHFPEGRFDEDVAQRLLRVNLSDLAAKGARPMGYLLSIALPEWVGPSHLQNFASGLERVQSLYDFRLFGGDTVSTPGQAVISATLIGQVPQGKMIKRNGARVGDDVWVTGSIGDGLLGLKTVMKAPEIAAFPPEARSFWELAYWRPQPPLPMRQMLLNWSTSAADISDGLVADLATLCESSEVGMEINLEDIPFAAPTQNWINQALSDLEAKLALITAGDDYQVVYTAETEARDVITALSNDLGQPVTRIGTCKPGSGVRVLDSIGREVPIAHQGYVHFQEKTR